MKHVDFTVNPLHYDLSCLHVFTGGSRLSQIFWEHENLSSLSIIRLIQLL